MIFWESKLCRGEWLGSRNLKISERDWDSKGYSNLAVESLDRNSMTEGGVLTRTPTLKSRSVRETSVWDAYAYLISKVDNLFIGGSEWGWVGMLHDSRKQPRDHPTTLCTLVSLRHAIVHCGCLRFLLICGWHMKFPSLCYVGGFFPSWWFRDGPRP